MWGEGLNIRAVNGYAFADLVGRNSCLKCCFARLYTLVLCCFSFLFVIISFGVFLFSSSLKAEEIIPPNNTSITIDISSSFNKVSSGAPLISLDDSRLFSDLSFLKLETFSGVDYTSNQIGFYSGGVSSLLGPYLDLPGLKLRAVYGQGYYQYRSSVRQGDNFVDVTFKGE